jgi:hypothetical protein
VAALHRQSSFPVGEGIRVSAVSLPRCVSCGVERKLVYDDAAAPGYAMRFYRCPICKTTLRLVERQSSTRDVVTKKPIFVEIECDACNGTGFSAVKQPMRPGRKVYAARCKKCGGKGRIKKAAN